MMNTINKLFVLNVLLCFQSWLCLGEIIEINTGTVMYLGIPYTMYAKITLSDIPDMPKEECINGARTFALERGELKSIFDKLSLAKLDRTFIKQKIEEYVSGGTINYASWVKDKELFITHLQTQSHPSPSYKFSRMNKPLERRDLILIDDVLAHMFDRKKDTEIIKKGRVKFEYSVPTETTRETISIKIDFPQAAKIFLGLKKGSDEFILSGDVKAIFQIWALYYFDTRELLISHRNMLFLDDSTYERWKNDIVNMCKNYDTWQELKRNLVMVFKKSEKDLEDEQANKEQAKIDVENLKNEETEKKKQIADREQAQKDLDKDRKDLEAISMRIRLLEKNAKELEEKIKKPVAVPDYEGLKELIHKLNQEENIYSESQKLIDTLEILKRTTQQLLTPLLTEQARVNQESILALLDSQIKAESVGQKKVDIEKLKKEVETKKRFVEKQEEVERADKEELKKAHNDLDKLKPLLEQSNKDMQILSNKIGQRGVLPLSDYQGAETIKARLEEANTRLEQSQEQINKLAGELDRLRNLAKKHDIEIPVKQGVKRTLGEITGVSSIPILPKKKKQ